jgi:hypothetical protein
VRFPLLLSPFCLLALQGAQRIPASAIGTWQGRSMVGPRDSVIATYTLTVTTDPAGIRLKLPNRDPQVPHLIAAAGDSILTERGPCDSLARPGLNATTRTISRFRGDSLSGAFTATYSDGSVTRGTTSGSKQR